MVNEVYHVFPALGKCRSRNHCDASDKMVLLDRFACVSNGIIEDNSQRHLLLEILGYVLPLAQQ